MEDDGVFVVDSTSNKSDNDLKLELPLSLGGVPSLDGSIKLEDKDSSLLFSTSSPEKGWKLDWPLIVDDGVFVVDSTSNKSDNDLKLELPLSLGGVPSLDGSIKLEDKDSSLLFSTSSSEKGWKLDNLNRLWIYHLQ